MATIEFSGGELTVQRRGFDRILVLQSRLTVPREHVTGVRGGEHDASEAFKGYRVGTSVPGLFTEGRFASTAFGFCGTSTTPHTPSRSTWRTSTPAD